jgi:hypothetical protein
MTGGVNLKADRIAFGHDRRVSYLPHRIFPALTLAKYWRIPREL